MLKKWYNLKYPKYSQQKPVQQDGGFILFYLFIYFNELFLATLGLCCDVQASHCGGFSCCGAWALGMLASVVVARGL